MENEKKMLCSKWFFVLHYQIVSIHSEAYLTLITITSIALTKMQKATICFFVGVDPGAVKGEGGGEYPQKNLVVVCNALSNSDQNL